MKEAPSSAERHANLGLCYAFMGRKEEAIREGRRAVELKPESKDAYDGAIMNCFLALIYARRRRKRSRHPVDRAIAAHARRGRQRELQHDRERSEVPLGMGPIAKRSPLSETRFHKLIAVAAALRAAIPFSC